MNEEHTWSRITPYSSIPWCCGVWCADHVCSCACSIASFGHASVRSKLSHQASTNIPQQSSFAAYAPKDPLSFFTNEEHTRPRITHYSSVPCHCGVWYANHVCSCVCSIASFGHASVRSKLSHKASTNIPQQSNFSTYGLKDPLI